jgi:hypothetical protein
MTDFEAAKRELLKQIDLLVKWNGEKGRQIEEVRRNIETITRTLEVLNSMK